MKKFLSILAIILTFFIVYFLQASLFTWFTINGVMPNLLVIFILWIGLFIGKKVGFGLGLLFGLYIDLLLGKAIGASAIMLALLGLAAEYIDKSFSKDSRITINLILAIGTAIYEIGIYAFQIIKWETTLELFTFSKILVSEMIYNMILVIILYPLMQKAGYKLESIFKNKNVLTRYF